MNLLLIPSTPPCQRQPPCGMSRILNQTVRGFLYKNFRKLPTQSISHHIVISILVDLKANLGNQGQLSIRIVDLNFVPKSSLLMCTFFWEILMTCKPISKQKMEIRISFDGLCKGLIKSTQGGFQKDASRKGGKQKERSKQW